MGYDSVVSQLGSFGPYHRRIFLILSLPAISWSFLKMGGVFLAAKPDFRCLQPHENQESAIYQIPSNLANTSYQWDSKTEKWPECETYNIDLADQNKEQKFSTMHTIGGCDSFVYDKTQYTLTATTEWDLVCGKEWLRTMSDSLFMLADLPGALIFSGLSDRYGRKLALLLGLGAQFILGLLIAISPGFVTFAFIRILVGTTVTGVFSVAYVSAVEMVSPKNRMVAATGINLSYISGYILIAGLAYLIPNWRTLQIVFTIPSLVFLLLSRSIPESTRWLLTKGRTEEAIDILYKASLDNGVELSQDTLNSLLKNNCESDPGFGKTSMFDILRYPNLRKRSLLLFLIWFVITLVYYGLSWNTSNLGGNDYLNFLIAAAVEVPAQVFVLITLNRWGRRITLCGSMCVSGISLLLTFFTPDGTSWLIIILAMIGKLAITVSYATVYVFTAELYPTTIRNIGVGACSGVGGLGGVITPYTKHLFDISPYVPLVMLGSIALVSGSLTLLLPETLNRKLPESLLEGEQFGKITCETKEDIERFDDSSN